LSTTMPTFFFKFRTGDAVDDDASGMDLPDLNAAREEAIQTARELVSNAVRFGHDDLPDHIIISDAANRSLSIVEIVDVLPRRLLK
jgi:hypothetical protein